MVIVMLRISQIVGDERFATHPPNVAANFSPPRRSMIA
jgi:hypothetical protein